ncbi:RHS repeat-associated core domain-containing protein [Lysobacter sp. Hz 25]|uniref:RHS repeat-associated core domain-containing protein n=1 Tax=Lysobacter sp. Hz 25 TaxID=3383698 RepID=UPI0038D3C2A9
MLPLLLLILAPRPAHACSESVEYANYPNSLILRADCKSYAEAQDACKVFAESLGHTASSCMNIGDGFQAGNFQADPQTNVIGTFKADPSRAKAEQNMGAPKCPGQCFGDPINAGNGNKYESKVEYRGEGPFPLEFSWTYNYLLPYAQLPPHTFVLGGNRTFNYGSRVAHWSLWGLGERVVVSRPDGKLASFKKPESGEYWTPLPGQYNRLRKLAGGWEYQDDDGHYEIFNTTGLLTELRDQNGHRQTLEYDANGRLKSVTDMLGRKLGFEFDASNLISQLNLPDGRAIKFAYTAQQRLSVVEYQDGSTVKYLYDEAGYIGSRNSLTGALTGVEDESGERYSSTRYDRDAALGTELAGSLDSYSANYEVAGNQTYMTYSAIGLPSGATRKVNLLSINGYTLPSKVVTECDGCAPRKLQYSYDANGRYDTVDNNGVITDYDYDGRGLLTRTIEAANDATGHRRTVETDWHANFRAPVETRLLDANGQLAAKSTWTYNARGQVLTASEVDPTGQLAPRTITYRYCEPADINAGTCSREGLPLSIDGPRTDVADITRYVYYANDDGACAASPSTCAYRKGDLWKIENALGRTVLEVLRYDGAGRVVSSRNDNGVASDYEFNSRGWLTATKTRGGDDASEADDQIVRMDYWPTGLVKKITLPDGAYTAYAYDAARRLTAVTDEAGNSIQYTLDSRGNRTRQDIKTSGGAVTHTLSRVYNLLDEVQAAKDASQNATSFTYDSRGNPNLATDALGRVTDQDYDPLDRLVRTLQDTNGLAVETKLQYDASDRITQVVDPKGLSTTYGYNGLGDQIQLSSPDTGVTAYGYNSAGQVTTKQDANDAAPHAYAYDALGRPKTISYGSGGNDVEYDYDTVNSVCTAGETFAIGRVTAMRSEGTELKYCYDRFGRTVRKVQTVDGSSFTLRYAYDKVGRLQALTYPDGAVADYTRDAGGRIVQVHVTPAGGTRTELLTGVTYQPFGPATGWTYGNGRSLARTYDQDYRAKTIFDSAAGGLSLAYGYNEVGELTELKDGLQSAFLAKYDYDTLGQLKITRDGPTGMPLETYGYDATGNRSSLLHGGITTSYTYPGTSHRLSNVGGVSRGYDAVGNTTSIGGTAREFVYNANDRMSQVKQAGVVKASYRYNAKGERVSRADNATGAITGYTLYDEAGHWLGDYDANGATKQQAIWLGDAPVGLVVGAGVAQTLRYVQPDHLGTPRAVIDPSRNLAVWTWDAKGEAFGNNPPNQDPDQDGTALVFDMRFPGQRFDVATGLNYNYFRDYDAGIGRYVQSDFLGLIDGPTTYSYALQNPVKNSDSLGLAVELDLFYRSNPPSNYTRGADRYVSPEGVYAVASHGSISEVRDPQNNSINARQLADMIRADPRFSGKKKVVLLSCNTGERGPYSFAQALSNELKIEVMAPDSYIFWREDGSYFLGWKSHKTNKYIPGTTGNWANFCPGGCPWLVPKIKSLFGF